VVSKNAGNPLTIRRIRKMDNRKSQERTEFNSISWTTENERKIVFWDCDKDTENLVWTKFDDAVYYWVKNCEEDLPETLMVYGFAPVEVPSPEKELADFLIDKFNEDSSDPDFRSFASEIMQNMVAAVFLLHQCERVCEVEINLPGWTKEDLKNG